LGFTLEREFGMRLEAVGARLFIRWDPDDLRRFILEYVLVHEVGHHVHYKERSSQKLNPLPSVEVQEQFAEDYAIRYIRAQGGIDYSGRYSTPLQTGSVCAIIENGRGAERGG